MVEIRCSNCSSGMGFSIINDSLSACLLLFLLQLLAFQKPMIFLLLVLVLVRLGCLDEVAKSILFPGVSLFIVLCAN